MTRLLDVWVPGLPVPQGSMRAVSVAGRARVFHANASDLNTWRAQVSLAAADLWGDVEPLDEACSIGLDFYLPRPKSAPRRRTHPDRLPDLDKLIRAVLDALTGLVFVDDARVVGIVATKLYAVDRSVGARIRVGRTLDLTEPGPTSSRTEERTPQRGPSYVVGTFDNGAGLTPPGVS